MYLTYLSVKSQRIRCVISASGLVTVVLINTEHWVQLCYHLNHCNIFYQQPSSLYYTKYRLLYSYLWTGTAVGNCLCLLADFLFYLNVLDQFLCRLRALGTTEPLSTNGHPFQKWSTIQNESKNQQLIQGVTEDHRRASKDLQLMLRPPWERSKEKATAHN